jgi:hypothetical protein
MNKSGLIAKLLSSVIVLILLFFILIGALVYASIASEIKGVEIPGVLENIKLGNNILLKEVNINGEEIIIIESMIRLEDYSGDVSRENLYNELEKIIKNDGIDYCLAIVHGKDNAVPGNQNSANGDFYFKGNGETAGSSNTKFRILRIYEKKYNKIDINLINKEKIKIGYYYGECKNDRT